MAHCGNRDQVFKSSEASTKSWFRTNGLIDKYLNILDLQGFRKNNTKWSNYSQQQYGVQGRLFAEENNGTKAIPNQDLFQQIDNKKRQSIFYQTDNSIKYKLKSIEILLSDKAKQIFDKGNKNNWSLDKILTELAIPKEQKQLLLDIGSKDREVLALELASKYSYSVEVNTATQPKPSNYEDSLHRDIISKGGYEYTRGSLWRTEMYGDGNREKITQEEYDSVFNDVIPTQYYSNLKVPGGTNYTENEISTPLITPSIKGHAQFSTDNGIGWFRSDDQVNPADTDSYGSPLPLPDGESWQDLGTKTRRILEVQSDLFQKGRDKESIHGKYIGDYDVKPFEYAGGLWGLDGSTKDDLKIYDLWMNHKEQYSLENAPDKLKEYFSSKLDSSLVSKADTKNQFLQLLNKDSNWVTFFIKSIVQDSAKQTITEVQESDVEAKVRELEQEGLLEIDCKSFKAKDGLRSTFTKGGKWKIIKDLKGYPTHKEGGVDLTIGKEGVKIKNGNTEFTAKHGLVIPKN